MVHSEFIFWKKKLCKRRRFLSDPGIGSFLIQIRQDLVRTLLSDSGGASLHPLTSCQPALKAG